MNYKCNGSDESTFSKDKIWRIKMGTFTTKDNTQIYYKDWGSGKPVVFSHGWPLNADAWESQMVFLFAHGYRCIAHDRRGHGRSDKQSNGNNMIHMLLILRNYSKHST